MRKTIFSRLEKRKAFGQTTLWLFRLLRKAADVLVGKSDRFFILTPPLFQKQIIYDKASGGFIIVTIRDLTDYSVICQIFNNHDYSLKNSNRSEELLEYYQQIIAAGKKPLIIDCGGNSGMATRYFIETYKEALIVCIEPDEHNIALAKANSAGGNVNFILAGVGGSDMAANLVDPGNGNWAYQVQEDENGKTQIISINSVLKSLSMDKITPFIVKIDIEGFERNLFEKNTEWIDTFPLLIIELHDWMLPGQANSQNFLKEIAKRNRDFVYAGENVYSVSNSFS